MDHRKQLNVKFDKHKGTDYHVTVNNMPAPNSPRKSHFKRLYSFSDQLEKKKLLKVAEAEAEELLKAVTENNVELCKNILDRVNISQKNYYFFHPLLLAAQKGFCDIITLLLQNNVDINVRDRKNSSALHIAIKQLHSKCALLLLSEGINFKELRDCHGNYAIHLAALEGKKVIDVIKWLLNNGQSPNVTNNKMQTPLHLAATKGHDGIIKLLLENREIPAKWEVKDSQFRFPLHYAALNGHSLCCEVLLSKSASQTAVSDKEGSTPLILAATKGHGRCCTTLISFNKEGLELKDSNGNTALHHAATNGFINTIEILLKENASCSITNNNGNTPIHMAVLQKNMESLQFLIEKHGKYPDINNLQQGLLHIAAIHGCEQSISYLVNLSSCNITINDRDAIGRTPLHYASLHSNLENIKILLGKGANCKSTDDDGNAPLHLAAGKGLAEICKLLLQGKGIEMINVKNKEGNTPLHLTVKNGSLYCCKVLMNKGALLIVENCNGFSPYHVAATKGNHEILKFFNKKNRHLISEAVEGSGDTPLHLIAKNGHFECCRYHLNLLKKNVILMSNESEFSPLDEAFFGKYDEVFALILSKCPPPKPNCNNYEFDATLHWYMHEAIVSKREIVVKAIAESEWWYSGFSSSLCKYDCCRNLVHLIEFSPEIMETIFGKCVEEIDNQLICDFRIFEQEYYVSSESQDDSSYIRDSPFDLETGKLLQDGTVRIKTNKNEYNSPLQSCIDNNCRELLQHPLIINYWKYKWDTYLKHILYCYLLAEIFIVMVIGLFMAHVWNWDQVNATLSARNGSLDGSACPDDLVATLEPSWNLLITLRATIAAIILFMCLLEINTKLKVNFRSYLTIGVLFRVCRIICIFALILPLTLQSCDVWITMSWQWLFGIIALMASWFNMIHTFNVIPSLSVFMPITSKFVKSFLLALFYIILILLIFSFVFHLIFNDHPAFANLGVAFIKSIVWTLGDLAYDDMFVSETKPLMYPQFSNIIFIAYVTSIGGFIVNLIITQPTDHFESFRNDAAWYEASSRIELLLKFDKRFRKLKKKYAVGFWVKNRKTDIKMLIMQMLYNHSYGNVTPEKTKSTDRSTRMI